MEVKPVLTIGFNSAAREKKESLRDINEQLTSQLPDYHVIVYTSGNIGFKDVKIEAFYPKDLDPIDLESLKAKVLEAAEM